MAIGREMLVKNVITEACQAVDYVNLRLVMTATLLPYWNKPIVSLFAVIQLGLKMNNATLEEIQMDVSDANRCLDMIAMELLEVLPLAS